MSKHVKHVPKHRAAPAATIATRSPQAGPAQRRVLFSSVAVAATGAAVSGGVLKRRSAVSSAASDLPVRPTAPVSADLLAERAADVPTSRSEDRRATTDPAKKAALASPTSPAITRTEDLSDDDPRDIARALLARVRLLPDQFSCLDALYIGESGWRVDADNPTSSAYGIPQALPGSKMASAGADWATNPATQIRWGLGYIRDRYGSPCGAWNASSRPTTGTEPQPAALSLGTSTRMNSLSSAQRWVAAGVRQVVVAPDQEPVAADEVNGFDGLADDPERVAQPDVTRVDRGQGHQVRIGDRGRGRRRASCSRNPCWVRDDAGRPGRPAGTAR